MFVAPRRRLGIRRLPLPTCFRCGPRLGPFFVPISRVRALGSLAARWEQAGHRGRWRHDHVEGGWGCRWHWSRIARGLGVLCLDDGALARLATSATAIAPGGALR